MVMYLSNLNGFSNDDDDFIGMAANRLD